MANLANRLRRKGDRPCDARCADSFGQLQEHCGAKHDSDWLRATLQQLAEFLLVLVVNLESEGGRCHGSSMHQNIVGVQCSMRIPSSGRRTRSDRARDAARPPVVRSWCTWLTAQALASPERSRCRGAHWRPGAEKAGTATVPQTSDCHRKARHRRLPFPDRDATATRCSLTIPAAFDRHARNSGSSRVPWHPI